MNLTWNDTLPNSPDLKHQAESGLLSLPPEGGWVQLDGDLTKMRFHFYGKSKLGENKFCSRNFVVWYLPRLQPQPAVAVVAERA